MRKKNSWQRKLAIKTAQWQCARAENTQLAHRLEQAHRNQKEAQRVQRQVQASAAELMRINRTYVEAFERMAAIVGRECIAAGVAQHRVLPHYAMDYPSMQYFVPEFVARPFTAANQFLDQRASLMLRILRAHPVVVDVLSKQVHFRAALGEHRVQCVYAISDHALMRMEAEVLTELISAELARLLVEQIKRAGL